MKKILPTVAVLASILAIPAIIMQFTDEVKWSLGDFLVAAVLLSLFAFAMHSIKRKVDQRNRRRILYLAFILVFLLIWAELAVGILPDLA